MTGIAIRDALSRPPVFGDTEQIAALKILRQAEAEKDEKRAEGKNEYRVTVSWGGEETVTVWAEDETEARAAALESVDLDDQEIDYHVRKVLST